MSAGAIPAGRHGAGAPAVGPAPLLSIDGLSVGFRTGGDVVQAVRDVSLDIGAGEIVALVGESGSGKSVSALTLLGLTRGPGTTISGSATFDGIDLLSAGPRELQAIRGRRIGMVFQDPMSSLNPVTKVGVQVAEAIRAHERVSKGEALRRAIEGLREVGIPEPADRADRYPHEFSGGMRQRVMIAMALACRPDLLLADEPTTALDVTVQAQILDLVLRLRDERGMAVLLVTHDLGVVAETADRVAVMYGGRIVEQAPVEPFFADPRHPYSWGLLGSIPPLRGERPPRLPTIAGTPPSPTALPDGCSFRSRCPHAFEACATLPPLAIGGPTFGLGNGGPGATPSATPGSVEGAAPTPAAPATAAADRCWLPLERKRALRTRDDGRVGLGGAA